jgi:hypothetical protein
MVGISSDHDWYFSPFSFSFEWSFVSNFDSIIAISCGLSESSMICALE